MARSCINRLTSACLTEKRWPQRHVRRIGSTMSAFLRESAAKSIKEGRPVRVLAQQTPRRAQISRSARHYYSY
jgi:hypothetical protein